MTKGVRIGKEETKLSLFTDDLAYSLQRKAKLSSNYEK